MNLKSAVFDHELHNRDPMRYFDHAATAVPKVPGLYEHMGAAVAAAGNPSRGGHAAARAGAGVLTRARAAVNAAFGGYGPERVVWTASCTHAANLLIAGLLAPGAAAVGTMLDHNAVRRPLCRARDEHGVRLTIVAPGDDGVLDPATVAAAVTAETRLVVLPHASNVTGIVQPVAAVAAAVRAVSDALVVVDAAQTVGVWPVHAREAGVDALFAGAHKGLAGPFGVGFALLSPRARPRPLVEGGTGGDSAAERVPADLPRGLEAGTPPLDAVAGLHYAVEVRAGFSFAGYTGALAAAAHEAALIERLLTALDGDERLRLLGARRAPRVGTAAFEVRPDGRTPVDAHEAAAVLEAEFGMAVRPGLHCAPDAHRWAGTAACGAVRVSVGVTTTADDIDALAHALRALPERL